MAGLQSVVLGVVSGLIALLGAGAGWAAAEIQVDGPRSCSRATELRTRVERALGRSLQELGEVSCRVHVVRDGGSYAARVEISSAGQTRTLRSFSAKTCPKLMDTLELAVVLAVGADAAPSLGVPGRRASATFASMQALRPGSSAERRERSEPSSASSGAALAADASPLAKEAPVAKAPLSFAVPGSSERASARASADGASNAGLASTSIASAGVAQPEPEAESNSEREALWRAFGGLVLDAGALPGPALGAQLGGSFGSELELRALGSYLLPREASVAGSGDVGAHGVDFALAAASVLGCAPQLVRAGAVALGACAGGELGAVWSGQNDLTRSRSAQALWSALRADVGARWDVAPSRLGIDVRLGLSMPLSRPRFTVFALGGGPSEVYRPSAIGGRLSLAATFALDGAP